MIGEAHIAVDGARAEGEPGSGAARMASGRKTRKSSTPARECGTTIPNDQLRIAAHSAAAASGKPGVQLSQKIDIHVSSMGDHRALAHEVAGIIDRETRRAMRGLFVDYGLDFDLM